MNWIYIYFNFTGALKKNVLKIMMRISEQWKKINLEQMHEKTCAIDKDYSFFLWWLNFYQVYEMNSLIFIKHVPVVWIEKKCKLIFISDDQYKYFIPIISNVIMMCYDNLGFIFKTSFRFTFVFRKDTHIMNISCSEIKIGFNINVTLRKIFTLLVYCL